MLAREWFTAQYGRPPAGPRELHGFIAKSTSHPRTSVAGYDLTFSPVKSVSALWAVADPVLAGQIRAAHEAAVADALAFIENRVLHTRQGHEGARQVDTRPSRRVRPPGLPDPDPTPTRTRSKPPRRRGHHPPHQAKAPLRTTPPAPSPPPPAGQVGRDGKRPAQSPARPRLLARWHNAATTQRPHRRPRPSKPTTNARRPRREDRPPSPGHPDTRQAKHQPRSEADQRTTWHTEAEQARPRWHPPPLDTVRTAPARPGPGRRRLATGTARSGPGEPSGRPGGTPLRSAPPGPRRRTPPPPHRPGVDRIVGIALGPQQAATRPPPTRGTRPARRPTAPPHQAAGTPAHHPTDPWAERRPSTPPDAPAAGPRTPTGTPPAQSLANREPLNPGQRLLVHQMATSGRRLQLAIAPAGTGKTTAMRALATAWTASGGTILGLAPSAAAAEQLRHQLTPARDGRTVAADNLAKLIWAINHREPLADQVGPDTLAIIDEAGMADTLTLDHLVSWCLDQGASVRLIGDDQQLGAIGAGGVLRDIAAEHGALRLDHVVRSPPRRTDASLALRAGTPRARHTSTTAASTSPTPTPPRSPSSTPGSPTPAPAGTPSSLPHRPHSTRPPHRPPRPPTRARNALADGPPPGHRPTRRNHRTLPAATPRGSATATGGASPPSTPTAPHGRTRSRAHLTLPPTRRRLGELGYATTIHTAQGTHRRHLPRPAHRHRNPPR